MTLRNASGHRASTNITNLRAHAVQAVDVADEVADEGRVHHVVEDVVVRNDLRVHEQQLQLREPPVYRSPKTTLNRISPRFLYELLESSRLYMDSHRKPVEVVPDPTGRRAAPPAPRAAPR